MDPLASGYRLLFYDPVGTGKSPVRAITSGMASRPSCASWRSCAKRSGSKIGRCSATPMEDSSPRASCGTRRGSSTHLVEQLPRSRDRLPAGDDLLNATSPRISPTSAQGRRAARAEQGRQRRRAPGRDLRQHRPDHGPVLFLRPGKAGVHHLLRFQSSIEVAAIPRASAREAARGVVLGRPSCAVELRRPGMLKRSRARAESVRRHSLGRVTPFWPIYLPARSA